jgi:aspartate racemase
MKTVGIIGGLGPETTANFYLEVVFSCFKEYKQCRPPMLIWNVPIPNVVEEQFITSGVGADVYIPLLADAAQRLERGGADFIVIPCNSVHMFITEVRNSVKIPVLSIVEETVDFLRDAHIKEIGILATSVTLRENVYEAALTKAGISHTSPRDEDQNKMGTIIHNLVQSKHTQYDEKELLRIINTFVSQDVHALVLACTDLQLIVPHHDQIQIYDTMKILAQSTVREILK